MLSLLAEEQEISDKLESCTFEGADELAGQRVIGVALSAGEKKNAPESIGTIVARPMVALPAISSGVFGVPINWDIVFDVVNPFLSKGFPFDE